MGKPDREEDCGEDCQTGRRTVGRTATVPLGSHGALKLLWRGFPVEGGAGSGHHGLLPHEPVSVPARWQTWKR